MESENKLPPTLTSTRTYVGVHVVAVRQWMTTNVLHWGIFVGPSLSTSGTLHNYVSRGAQSYVYEKDEHYTPKASSNDQFVVAHRVGEVSTSDALLFETKLSGIQIPPGADCQRWVFTALNHLQKQLLGWIDVPPMAPLRDHMPSRERPRGVFHSTVGTLRDLKELDSSDYTRIASIDAESLFPSTSTLPPIPTLISPTTTTQQDASGARQMQQDLEPVQASAAPPGSLHADLGKRLRALGEG